MTNAEKYKKEIDKIAGHPFWQTWRTKNESID